MANIQPFNYQESTNIEEHNQIVNKVNEIVEVINNVNLDTINSEIADLKSKATATDTEIANIKDKDTTQDTEINGITKNLVSNVTATFDNPSRELKISLGREVSPSIDATVVIPASSETGQYSAGNGITIDNYQIAVDTGVVALKTDIPVVPDVSEITTRLDTIDGEITGINTDITNITNKNTEQDTAINGKVAISQGTENAGKVLGIGSDGNVTPVNAGGGSGSSTINTLTKDTIGNAYNLLSIGDLFVLDRIGSSTFQIISFIGVVDSINTGNMFAEVYGSGLLLIDGSTQVINRILVYNNTINIYTYPSLGGTEDEKSMPISNIFMFGRCNYYHFS